jgi:hypothetical protein
MKRTFTLLFGIVLAGLTSVIAKAELLGMCSSSYYSQEISLLGISPDAKLTGSGEVIGKQFVQPLLESNFKTLSGSGLVQNISVKLTADENIELTNTRNIHYVLLQNGIEVFGSLISLEIDSASNQFLDITMIIGNPGAISSIAKVTLAQVLENLRAKAEEYVGKSITINQDKVEKLTVLNFYYDDQASKWRLAYLIPGDLMIGVQPNGSPIYGPIQMVVDAGSAELIKVDVLFDAH